MARRAARREPFASDDGGLGPDYSCRVGRGRANVGLANQSKVNNETAQCPFAATEAPPSNGLPDPPYSHLKGDLLLHPPAIQAVDQLPQAAEVRGG